MACLREGFQRLSNGKEMVPMEVNSAAEIADWNDVQATEFDTAIPRAGAEDLNKQESVQVSILVIVILVTTFILVLNSK